MPAEKRELEELEIDINKPEPLNKKQKRLLKKGKLDPVTLTSTETDANESNEPKEHKILSSGEKKSKFGVWIGNLSFDTSRDDLIRFFNSRNIPDTSIIRVHLPMSKRNKAQNMGFAYVDFLDQESLDTCISLSESNLNGRNLLIKNEQSQEGRPPPKDSKQHAASRILFIGNLSFDTSQDDLQQLFQHCGDIVRIRMATFQDTGNCKGFAFVDFKEVESAVKAITDKRCKKLHGRLLRMEYGEDRSKRRPGQQTRDHDDERERDREHRSERRQERSQPEERDEPVPTTTKKESKKEAKKDRLKSKARSSGPTSGMALAKAQRAKQSIVPSQGKKVTFD